MAYRFLISVLFTGLMVSFSSCSKDNGQVIDPVEENDTNYKDQKEEARYYVKYEISSKTLHWREIRTIRYNDEKGTQTLTFTPEYSSLSWEGTYGPVKKGFSALLSCDVSEIGTNCMVSGRIYVCREKEPFVVKAEQSSSYGVDLHYVIDF